MTLSEEQLREFEERGYTVLRQLGTPEITESLATRVEEYLHGERPLEERMAFKFQRGKKPKRRGGNLEFIRKIKHLEYEERFWSFISDPRVVGPLTQVLGPDVLIWRADVFYKRPKTGWGISPHQDAVYWPISPIDDTYGTTSSLFYFMDDSDETNGGLGFLPGRHKEGPIPSARYDGDNAGERRISDECYSDDEKVYPTVSAGDAVLFHGMLPHLSERNTSQKPRRALAITCWSARLKYSGFRKEIHGHEDPDYDWQPLKQLAGRTHEGCVF